MITRWSSVRESISIFDLPSMIFVSEVSPAQRRRVLSGRGRGGSTGRLPTVAALLIFVVGRVTLGPRAKGVERR